MGWLRRMMQREAAVPPPPAPPAPGGPPDPGAAPMAQPAPPEAEVIHHCPWCASGNVTGGSDGTIKCGFCQKIFKVFIQPAHPYMPQTVNGQPFEIEGSPLLSDEPVPAAGGVPPTVNGGPAPTEAPTGLESFRVDPGAAGAAQGEPGGGLDQFRVASFVTSDGIALPLDSYVARLAIEHAPDRDAVIEQVRASRG